MRHRSPRSFVILTVCVLSIGGAGVWGAAPAEAVWVWTPNTGKWINPRYAVKDTPEEQYKFAQSFVQKQDYNRARIEFKGLLKHFPQSAWAPDAQIALAQTYEAEADYYQAFLEYRRALQTYPSVTRVDEVIGREFHIGELFLKGQKRRLLGRAAILPAQDKAVEIFQAILEDAPYSSWGDQAQFKLGESYAAVGQFDDAKAAFEALLQRYPDSPLTDRARFEIAMSAKRNALSPAYDQAPANEALQEFAKFKDEHPTSPLQSDVDREVKQLVEQRAQHDFEVAQFYEQQQALESAKIYYRDIVDNYQDTSWASKAQARLQALGGMAAP